MIPCNVELPRVPFGAYRGMPCKGTLSEINSKDPFMYFKYHMNGEKEAVFHVNLIDILDKVFLMDGTNFLSREQERFLAKYIEVAELLTEQKNIDTLNIDYYNDLGIIGETYSEEEVGNNLGVDPIFIKLDHFLGNYKGVDENEYTR